MKTYMSLTRIAAIAAVTLILPVSVNAGLIAQYTFDGALTADSSGNGNTLTNGAGGPSSTAGKFGNAADFAGGAFLFSASTAFNLGTGNFAISLWYQATQAGFSPLVGKNNSGTDTGYALSHDAANITGDLGDTVGGFVSTTRPVDDTSEFRHLVYQKNGATIELYLDGSLASTFGAASGSNSGNAFAIGSRNISAGGGEGSGGTSQKFNGLMDEVYVFDNVLTATEISNLEQFNSLESVSISEPGALALFGLGLFGLGYARRRRA
jgi:arabinan endo-1,5-alpha-L-arabinosidase